MLPQLHKYFLHDRRSPRVRIDAGGGASSTIRIAHTARRRDSGGGHIWRRCDILATSRPFPFFLGPEVLAYVHISTDHVANIAARQCSTNNMVLILGLLPGLLTQAVAHRVNVH